MGGITLFSIMFSVLVMSVVLVVKGGDIPTVVLVGTVVFVDAVMGIVVFIDVGVGTVVFIDVGVGTVVLMDVVGTVVVEVEFGISVQFVVEGMVIFMMLWVGVTVEECF
jgi:hypothetical protein